MYCPQSTTINLILVYYSKIETLIQCIDPVITEDQGLVKGAKLCLNP